MKNKVLDAIRLIHGSKILNRIEPNHALLNEVVRETGLSGIQVMDFCAELYREGMIDGGKTIHDSYFIPKIMT